MWILGLVIGAVCLATGGFMVTERARIGSPDRRRQKSRSLRGGYAQPPATFAFLGGMLLLLGVLMVVVALL